MKIGTKVVLSKKYLKWLVDNFYDLYFIPGTNKLGRNYRNITFLFTEYVSKKPTVGKIVKFSSPDECLVKFNGNHVEWVPKKNLKKVKEK